MSACSSTSRKKMKFTDRSTATPKQTTQVHHKQIVEPRSPQLQPPVTSTVKGRGRGGAASVVQHTTVHSQSQAVKKLHLKKNNNAQVSRQNSNTQWQQKQQKQQDDDDEEEEEEEEFDDQVCFSRSMMLEYYGVEKDERIWLWKSFIKNSTRTICHSLENWLSNTISKYSIFFPAQSNEEITCELYDAHDNEISHHPLHHFHLNVGQKLKEVPERVEELIRRLNSILHAVFVSESLESKRLSFYIVEFMVGVTSMGSGLGGGFNSGDEYLVRALKSRFSSYRERDYHGMMILSLNLDNEDVVWREIDLLTWGRDHFPGHACYAPNVKFHSKGGAGNGAGPYILYVAFKLNKFEDEEQERKFKEEVKFIIKNENVLLCEYIANIRSRMSLIQKSRKIRETVQQKSPLAKAMNEANKEKVKSAAKEKVKEKRRVSETDSTEEQDDEDER